MGRLIRILIPLLFVSGLVNVVFADTVVTFSSTANSISIGTDASNNPENPGFATMNAANPFRVVLDYSGGTKVNGNYLLTGASVNTFWNGVLDSTLSMNSSDASILLTITSTTVTLNACAPDANGCSGTDMPGFGDQLILDGSGLSDLNSLTPGVWSGLKFDTNGQLTVTAFNADGSESQIIGAGGNVTATSTSAVPEPSTVLLLVSGGVALISRRHKKFS